MDVACIGGSAVEGCIDALELRDASLEHRRDLRVVADVATPGSDVISAIDDRYKNLPGRVGRLEGQVFGPR